MNEFDYTPGSFEDTSLTPEEFIGLMFERTDLDGILLLPGWYYDGPSWDGNDIRDSYRCHMNWTITDMDYIISRFHKLYAALKKIAVHLDDVKAIKDPELLTVWDKYLRGLDAGGLSREKAQDIEDRLHTQRWIQMIASNFAKGQALEDYEKEALIEYMDISVSEEEKAYSEQFQNNLYKDAQRRIGGKICAYAVIFHARRVCRLLHLKAPAVVINNEANSLAAAMVMNAFGDTQERVDNSIRLWKEQQDLMSDEELDAMESPKKMNSVKSLAPVFVVQILKEKTNSAKHMRQVDILEELKKYEIFIERKALNRTIHTLAADPRLPIRQDQKSGVWYEQ